MIPFDFSFPPTNRGFGQVSVLYSETITQFGRSSSRSFSIAEVGISIPTVSPVGIVCVMAIIRRALLVPRTTRESAAAFWVNSPDFANGIYNLQPSLVQVLEHSFLVQQCI